MKVLFVSDSTTLSGAEVVLLTHLEALKRAGHNPAGFVRHNNVRLIQAFRNRGVPVAETRNYSNHLIRTTADPVALSSYARAFLAIRREMAGMIRAGGIDLIHSISYPASLYASFAAAQTGTPHIWHEHNIKRIHPVNRLIYRKISRGCNWVIGPSEAVTSNLTGAGIDPKKLRTVYNGIDLRRFGDDQWSRVKDVRRELGLRSGDKAVGLFGQMLPNKGHRTLIDAAPLILKIQGDAHFCFVGALENPAYERELKAQLESLGLATRFTFTGWRDDVPQVMRAMDVVVVATTTPEPAALTLMEAMAAERPLVASRTGGTAEIVIDEETGLLFPPGDPRQLACQVNRLLVCPGLAHRLGEAGRRRVEKDFSRQRHLEMIFGLYGLATSVVTGAL